MEKLKLVKPTIEYKSQAKEYIDEFYKYNSRINGVGGLDRFLKNSTYEEWLLKIENDEKRIITEEKVPAKTMFLVREVDNMIIGMVKTIKAVIVNLKQNHIHLTTLLKIE